MSSNNPNNNNNNNNNDTSGGTTIHLDTLSLDQLNQMKQEQEGQLQALTQRYAALRAAAARLYASQNAITELSPITTTTSTNTTTTSTSTSSTSLSENGKSPVVMIPLTESVYVPGTIKEPNKLLVDIGTGFYVEKTSKQTHEFLARKLKLVDTNSENITLAVQTVQSNLSSIHQAMQGKLLEIQARQQGQRHRREVMEEGTDGPEEGITTTTTTTTAVTTSPNFVGDD